MFTTSLKFQIFSFRSKSVDSDKPTKYKSARPVYDDPLWNLYDSIYMKVEPRRKQITYGVSFFIGLILVGSLAYGIIRRR
ncbi:MAG: hypothetical protein FD167_3147 [bacterium]|nr:MAG: hypothetical protein FD167_3147 [bacterium]